MSKSLAVKYRPKTWEEISEQKSIVKILKQELETNHIKNCYLFCGASGCGKTTAARIFARDLNSGVGEPIEIDAASNNSVENVRNLIKSAQERALSGIYKVFIIDEAHALSNQAWQAFLKCIEEPPQFTVFIFCTTDPQKIPDTILNRVERFNFNRISSSSIEKRLDYICNEEHFTNYKETISYIAKSCNGGMRDAIAMLDKAASYSTDLTIQNSLEALGEYSYEVMFKLLNAFIDGSEKEVFYIIDNYYNKGNDLKIFIDRFLDFVLDVEKYALFKDLDMIKIPSSLESELSRTIAIDNYKNYFMYVIDNLLDLKFMLRNDSDIKSTIEVMLTKICRCK